MLNYVRQSTWASVGLFVLLLASESALAKPWYITSDITQTLYDFNDETVGPATNPRVVSPIAGDRIVGIDSMTPGSTLFALTSRTDGGAVAGDNSLYTINPATGQATLVGGTGLSSLIEGDIGFDGTTGTLYGMFQQVSVNGFIRSGLYTFNTSNGAATFVAGIQNSSLSSDPSGLAFDGSGQLWIMGRNGTNGGTGNWRLLQVDKSNGNISQNFDTGISAVGSDTLGLDFDDEGNLFAAVDNGNFYSVSTVDGSTSIVEAHGLNATGLALVPEPSTIALLATLPALLLAWIVWRRRRQARLPAAVAGRDVV